MIEIEKREFDVIGESSKANGRSAYECVCPYCKTIVEIQKWSFRSVGKKCVCGAVLRGGIARKMIKEESY